MFQIIWNISFQDTGDPESQIWKQMRWAQRFPQFIALRDFSGLWCREGELKKRLMDSLHWEDRTECPERPRWLEFSGERTEEEKLHKDKTPDIYKDSPLAFSWGLIRTRIWGKYPQGQVENHPKGLELTVSGVNAGPETMPVPTSHTRKPQNSLGIG